VISDKLLKNERVRNTFADAERISSKPKKIPSGLELSIDRITRTLNKIF
jgi:catalase